MTIKNATQIEFWNGETGQNWVSHDALMEAMLQPLGEAVMDSLSLKPGEHVLDIGCGCGHTSLSLADRVGAEGSVTGIDISAPMLAVASQLAAEHNTWHNSVQFLEADAQTHRFTPGSYDAAFSRFGVMFFEDSVAAFANLRRALKAEGRLAFACWQSVERNGWVHVPRDIVARHIALEGPADPTAPGPFAFGPEGRAAGLLRDAGFRDITVEAHDTEVVMGGGGSVEAAVYAVTDQGPLSRAIHDAPEDVQQRIREDLTAALSDHAQDDAVRLGAGVWLVTARA